MVELWAGQWTGLDPVGAQLDAADIKLDREHIKDVYTYGRAENGAAYPPFRKYQKIFSNFYDISVIVAPQSLKEGSDMAKVTCDDFPGWDFEIRKEGCFRYAYVTTPERWKSCVGQHDRNPENVLFKLVEAVINHKNGSSSDSTLDKDGAKSPSLSPCETKNP